MLLSSFLILNRYVSSFNHPSSMLHIRKNMQFTFLLFFSLYFDRTDSINKYTIYPYVHSFSNITSRQTILQPISIPDVLPTALPPGSDFSLVAGKSKYIFSKSLAPCFRHHIGLGPILCLAYDHIILSGDFEEIYGAEADPNEPQAGEWNAILTCFFIDTVSTLLFVPCLSSTLNQGTRC